MKRVWLLGLLTVLVWALIRWGAAPEAPLGPDAPAARFSAARAETVLARLLGPERPHPAGSAEDAAMHARLEAALTRLGVPFRRRTAMSCFSERHFGVIECGTVTDILAEAVPGKGRAVLLMAHMDSVPAGPGASDDASGVAALLETIRALRADHMPGHPVLALFTDGEEYGMLGAAAFLRDAAWRGRVGVVINAEARGNRGPSYLFQTSPGDGPLVALYAQSVARPHTSSLYADIYRILPNDTDLTPFLEAGFTGYNFAFVDDVAQYHTPLDRRANLDPATLQSHGDSLLGLTRGLMRSDFATLKGGNAIYFDILGRWLPRLPTGWALPLALLAFLAIVLAAWRGPRGRHPVRAALMPPVLLIGCVAMGFAVHGVAAVISGESAPGFAHPLAMRLALAFGAWSVALFVSRWAGALASWLWLAGLGIVTAWVLPGISPYFLFPSLVAAVALWLLPRRVALFVGALAALVAWLSLTLAGEVAMGLSLHPVFMLTAGMALVALLPLLRAVSGWPVGISLAAALVAAIVAGLEPAYGRTQPERLNLHYLEAGGKAWWLADPVARLPASLARFGFSQTPQPFLAWRMYRAPAGGAQFPSPGATVTHQGGGIVTLDLHGSPAAGGMTLVIPARAGLTSAAIDGISMKAAPGQVTLTCQTPDCAHAHIVLHFAAAEPLTLLLLEQRRCLPPKGAMLAKARPSYAVPSQFGDGTILARAIALPDPQ